MVLATAVPANAPMKLNAVAMTMAWRGMERPGRYGCRDGVGGVVEAVDVVEGDGEDDDDDQQQGDAFHALWMVAASGVAHRPAVSPCRPGYPSRMRLSSLFFTTLRDDPADAEMPSHRLLVRAGYIRQLGSGIYSLLPLGKRVSKRVEQVIREEQDRIGGQEMEMPVVHPADIWRRAAGTRRSGPELARFKDRNGRDMVLAITHEEVVGMLLADIVRSYRQLPMMVYHFQTKWRDEPRSRGGLIRVREFVMKDAYSCDRDEAGLDASYGRNTVPISGRSSGSGSRRSPWRPTSG